jgi:hypothetical protein
MNYPMLHVPLSPSQPHADGGALPLPGFDQPCCRSPSGRRDRIWDLPPSLHCSIVGTCLPASALRQLFARLEQADAKSASDHDLHSRAVRIAAQHDLAGKMLNRMLDKRHEAHVKRFARAKTVAELRRLWLEALERGDIPGAYWAVLTHPATDQGLVTEVFGEVHMLSHLVGMSNRADIVRLRTLEESLGQRDEKIARQEARLRRMAGQREELTRRIEMLEAEARRRPCAASAADTDTDAQAIAALKQRLADEQARSRLLSARLEEQDRALTSAGQTRRQAEQESESLRQELAALEATLGGLMEASTPETEAASSPDLAGKRLLFVGGRPRQLDRLRSLAASLGGTLLTHDGGVEESTALLPGLLSQADAAFFPVDCVSHLAAGRVKRFCQDTGKPFIALRNASMASFLAGLGQLPAASDIGGAQA